MQFIIFQLNNKTAFLMPGQVRHKPLRKFALKHFDNAVKSVRDSHSFLSVLYTTLQVKKSKSGS